MHDTLTPVWSFDLDRRSTLPSIPLERLTPAERLTLRLGTWLVRRSSRRLERAAEVPKRNGEYAQAQRERVIAQAHLLGCLRP
ncbi:hypothetical protein [Microbacterium ulmi]|uniref:Uncharacterized protein n=1 Tax=Microbacterium ulmi TaxID=179095 RepID=A0A7Y2LZW6_9MICO|nr:hypothetical protein [Microbacterium ulmi]NII71249.1 hypothetical protein [Microbacterium ulmi]NNH02553.1 hypothetical protein [Microbacterium ulmi]